MSMIFDKQELKEAILSKAFRGELTEQNYNEGTGEELLKRIQSDKLESNKGRKNVKLDAVLREDEPYELPPNWTWTRLGEVVDIHLGLTHKPDYHSDGIPFISVKDISKGSIDFQKCNFISKEKFDSIGEGCKPKKGDILFGRVGTLGKPNVVEVDFPFATFVSLGYLRGNHFMNSYFLKRYMETQLFWDSVNHNVKGSAQINLNTGWLKNFEFPLPPLAEQHRIVAKIERAFELIDSMDVDSLLQDISDFRQEILTRAFRGDLTEQNFDEGTGMELLKSIQLERQNQQPTKGKKKTELAPVSKEEELYELPPNWTWTRLGEVINSSNRNQNIEDDLEVSFVPMTVVADGFKNEIKPEVKVWSNVKKGYTHLKDGDVVFAKITPCFQNRKSAVIQGLKNDVGAGSTELVVLSPVGGLVNPKLFFYLALSKEFIDGGVNTYQGTAGQQRVSMDWLRNYPFPLPPLAEQHRIVTKIEAIFSALDVMEDAITKQKDEAKACYEEILRKEMKSDVESEKELETTSEEMVEVRVG